MSRIAVRRTHRMKTTDLRERAENLARQLQDRFGGDYHWEGDTVHYHYGGGIDAFVKLGAKDIVVEAKLGLLMRVFRHSLEREINSYLDDHLA